MRQCNLITTHYLKRLNSLIILPTAGVVFIYMYTLQCTLRRRGFSSADLPATWSRTTEAEDVGEIEASARISRHTQTTVRPAIFTYTSVSYSGHATPPQTETATLRDREINRYRIESDLTPRSLLFPIFSTSDADIRFNTTVKKTGLSERYRCETNDENAGKRSGHMPAIAFSRARDARLSIQLTVSRPWNACSAALVYPGGSKYGPSNGRPWRHSPYYYYYWASRTLQSTATVARPLHSTHTGNRYTQVHRDRTIR